MGIPVLLFASYADALGSREVVVPLNPPSSVEALIEALRSLPGGTALPAAPQVAVNRRLASRTSLVSAGDEVALIPPVAGG